MSIVCKLVLIMIIVGILRKKNLQVQQQSINHDWENVPILDNDIPFDYERLALISAYELCSLLKSDCEM